MAIQSTVECEYLSEYWSPVGWTCQCPWLDEKVKFFSKCLCRLHYFLLCSHCPYISKPVTRTCCKMLSVCFIVFFSGSFAGYLQYLCSNLFLLLLFLTCTHTSSHSHLHSLSVQESAVPCPSHPQLHTDDSPTHSILPDPITDLTLSLLWRINYRSSQWATGFITSCD